MKAETLNEQRERTVAELEREVAARQAKATEAIRALGEAREALSLELVTGNEMAIAGRRRDISKCETGIASAREELTAYRNALAAAQTRESGGRARRVYEELVEQAATARRDVIRIEQAARALAAAVRTARASLGVVEVSLGQYGASVNQYGLRSQLPAVISRHLYVETDGLIGKPYGLESAFELRESGASSLTKAATDFEVVARRDAERLLGIPPESSPPRAA